MVVWQEVKQNELYEIYSTDKKWWLCSLWNRYSGPYLLEAIDSLQPPIREFSKPLLMPICDVIKSTTLGQISACGKLEAGALRSGSKV